MSDERDPELLRHFASAQTSLDEGPFLAETERRLGRLRRARRVQRWAMLGVLLALVGVAGPHAITASVEMHQTFAEFLVSPLGWGASFVVGALVVWRARALG
jgi:hypothetical protein